MTALLDMIWRESAKPEESMCAFSRRTATGLAAGVVLALTGLFAVYLSFFYVPAYQGVDENGYIITAKLMAQHRGIAGKCSADAYEFVSGNMVEGRDGVYFAKYPIGYPMLCVGAIRLGGPDAIYLINPLLATLSLVGMFLLGRSVIGIWAGVLAAILLAANPLNAYFGLSALSHSGSTCFGVWGMFFAWRWLQKGGLANAALAGCLSAYALTIRYSDALLVFPMGMAVLWRGVEIWRTTALERRAAALLEAGVEIGVMGLTALLAVLPLYIHHWVAYGSPWVNGYTLCQESTGFSWEWFEKNWRLMLGKMDSTGLFLIFPVGLLGLIYLFFHDLKKAVFLALWIMPTLLLYTAYYWAPVGEGWGYVRFFTGIFPPLVICALAMPFSSERKGAAWNVAVGLFVLLVAGANLKDSVLQLERMRDRLLMARHVGDLVKKNAPPDGVVFADDYILNFIEYVGDYRLYPRDLFDIGAIKRRITVLDNKDPHPFQRQKARRIADLFGKKNNAQLAELQRKVVERHVKSGRPVFVLAQQHAIGGWRGRLSSQFDFLPRGEVLDVTVSPRGDRRATVWSLHELRPQENPEMVTTNSVSVKNLQQKIDQLQFHLENLRTAHRERYPGAQESQNRISYAERELRDFRERLRRLTTKKKAPPAAKPRVPPTVKPPPASAAPVVPSSKPPAPVNVKPPRGAVVSTNATIGCTGNVIAVTNSVAGNVKP
ncbi:MAG: hypothetical protein PHV34_06365 [Verrucomicrobiae bacterium]|nr:hypothetical protein [Verrucomicrobiae bacterium]